MLSDPTKGIAGTRLPHNRRVRDMQPSYAIDRRSRQTLGHNLLNNLVDFWPLCEPNINDTYRFGVHANLTVGLNAIGSVAGNAGTIATTFSNGSGAYLSRASSADLQFGAGVSFTLSAWIKFSVLPPPNSALAEIIVSKDTTAAGGREYSMQYVTTPGNIRMSIFDGTSNLGGVISPAWTASAGVWYFVVGRRDASVPNVSINVNAGALINASATTTLTPATTASAFNIGADGRAGNTAGFDGSIQRVGVWRRAITDDEIAYLYNGGTGRDYPFL